MRRALTGLLITALSSFGLASTTQVFATAPPPDRPDRATKPVTRVTLAPPMVKKLRRADIDVRAIKPAKATKFKGHPAIRLPIAKKRKDVVEHRGGIALVKNHKRAKATRLWGDYDKGRVSALINGSKRTYVFNARKSDRPGLGKIRLVLTRYTAGSLNATFGTKRFERGDTFGYAKVRR